MEAPRPRPRPRTTRRTDTRMRQVVRPTLFRLVWGRATDHLLTKVIALALGALVWVLIDQQLTGEIFEPRELNVVVAQDADSERSLRIQVPPNWVVLSLRPQIVRVSINGRKAERDVVRSRLPLTMNVSESDLGRGGSEAREERIVLDGRAMSLPGLTNHRVNLSENIVLTVSPRTSRDFRLVLAQPGIAPEARHGAVFSPPTVTVQGALARLEALGAANFEIPISATEAELAREVVDHSLLRGRIEAALRERFPNSGLELTSGTTAVRMQLTPPSQRTRSHPLPNVRVLRSESDPLVELDLASFRFTTVQLVGNSELVDRIAGDPDLARRVASSLVVIAELQEPLRRALDPRRGDGRIGEWVDVKIDKEHLYVSPNSIAAFRRTFPEFSSLDVREPKEFLERARLRDAESKKE